MRVGAEGTRPSCCAHRVEQLDGGAEEELHRVAYAGGGCDDERVEISNRSEPHQELEGRVRG